MRFFCINMRLKTIKIKNAVAQSLGRKGGQATSKLYGKEHFKKAQAKSVLVRKQNTINRQSETYFKLADMTTGNARTSLKPESEG